MWLEVDKNTFSVNQQGFELRAGDTQFYTSEGAPSLSSIRDLAHLEYIQAVEINVRDRKVSFGRDYLGFYPLLYGETDSALFISDELSEVVEWLHRQGVSITVSPESVALYFTMGYVPQGCTLLNEVMACENASIYHLEGGKVRCEDIFRPIEVDSQVTVDEVGRQIEAAVDHIAAGFNSFDIWCSGGLDSSIMASSFSRRKLDARLLTMSYDPEVAQMYGEGELPYAYDVQNYTSLPLDKMVYTKELYATTYTQMVKGHICPVIDMVVPPKYALASASKRTVITGEGGDPIFSGVKNNKVLYMQQNMPDMRLGEIYAIAHNRIYNDLPFLLKDGQELKQFVIQKMDSYLEKYPGDLMRKMFYINTMEKQGGMIFPKNYYAAKRYGKISRHPLTALDVYEIAFKLRDDKKYAFPAGKLSLIEYYRDQLPDSIINRKKSGTRLPLAAYFGHVLKQYNQIDELINLGIFDEQRLTQFVNKPQNEMSGSDLLLLYSLITLNYWLKNNLNRKKAM